MCQSNLFTIEDGRRDLILKDVADVQVAGDRLTIKPLIGPPISLAARIQRIDLMKHEIVVEKIGD